MNEKLLEFIWTNRLLPSNLTTTQNEKVEILNYGIINQNSGPDIYAAKIRIGKILWVGNVEFHVKSSHWTLHGHTNDPNYNNVILHIVFIDDTPLKDRLGNPIPTITIPTNHPLIELSNTFFNQVAKSKKCPAKITEMSQINRTILKERLATERLQHKTEEIKKLLTKTNGDWNNMFFRLLARAFGFGKNSFQMETLAQSVTLSIIEKNRDSLYSAIAIMLGQAGLIHNNIEMVREYSFYKQKYNLSQPENIKWENKLRPKNRPEIRIAQFTALICKKRNIFSHILEITEADEMLHFFTTKLTDKEPRPINIATLTKQSALLLAINAAIPTMFVYGQMRNMPQYQEKAIELLQKLPQETNSIVKKQQENGLIIKNAWDSQAAIQLSNNYCKPLKCIECQIFRQQAVKIIK